MKKFALIIILILTLAFYAYEINNQDKTECVGLHPETNVKNVKNVKI